MQSAGNKMILFYDGRKIKMKAEFECKLFNIY